MEDAAKMFKALAHPTRVAVMQQLGSHGEATVTVLQEQVDVSSQSCLSQHLKVLRSAGLVSTRRESQRVFYSADAQRLSQANDLLIGMKHSA